MKINKHLASSCSIFLVVALVSSKLAWAQPKTEDETLQVDAVKIYKDREDTIAKLLLVLKNSDDKTYDGSLHRAIDSLGQIRAKEGVKPIAARLSFLPEVVLTRQLTLSPWETERYYPSASALFLIGDPSDVVPQMTDIIYFSEDKVDWALSCWVLMKVQGKDATIKILTEKVQQLPMEYKVNFIWALNYVKNYDPSYGDPRRGKFLNGSFSRLLESTKKN